MADSCDIKLICVDLDGTVLDFDDLHCWFADDFVEVLNILGERGVRWCTNSGRNHQNQLGLIQACRPMRNMPVAIGAGERFIYWFEPLYHAHEPFNTDMRNMLDELNPKVHAALDPHRERLRREFSFIEEFDRDKIVGWKLSDEAQAPALVEEYERILADVPDAQVLRNHEWVIANHVRAGKGILLEEIAGKLGIPQERILAVGDQDNDRDMLTGRAAKYVGCPNDAGEEIKAAVLAAGGIVSKKEHTAGTVDIIKQLFDL